MHKAENIWNAARYLRSGGSLRFHHIPFLNHQRGKVEANMDMGDALLSEFFPWGEPVRDSHVEAERSAVHQLDWHPLTVAEVKEAAFKAQPYKAPGPDGIPAVAWKELWPMVRSWIRTIFTASARCGHIPQSWRQATILALRELGKDDYRVAKAYRPISLLPTLAKTLEAVIANRLSYWAEAYSLLPKDQFGARKRRSTIQALTLLQEKIYEAWQEGKVLSLVSFNVKGAYNGVDKTALLQRLRCRQIPETLVR